MNRIILLLLFFASLNADNQATQNLRLGFGLIDTISFVNDVVQIPLIIDQADAGGQLQQKNNIEQQLCYQTNASNRKIIAFLDRPTPDHTFLSVEVLQAVGTSTGKQRLTNYPVTLVTNIPNTTCPGANLKYTWEATILAGPVEISTYTVTYSLVEI